MADERKTIRKYLVIGVVIMSVVGLACYDLWMRVEHQFYSNGLTVTGLPKMGKGVPGAGGGILGTLFPLPAKRGQDLVEGRLREALRVVHHPAAGDAVALVNADVLRAVKIRRRAAERERGGEEGARATRHGWGSDRATTTTPRPRDKLTPKHRSAGLARDERQTTKLATN